MILSARGQRLDLGARPLLMGIVNASPDSFSDGRSEGVAERVARGRALIAAGADILDIGGETARGDRPAVAASVEIERVSETIAALAGDVLVSVDTYKPEVAEAAIAAGASIVNDVSGLRDLRLAEVCARTGAALVLMHTRVEPKGTLLDPGTYDVVLGGGGRTSPLGESSHRREPAGRVVDVVADVLAFLRERFAAAVEAGVGFEQLILDPGPDFAKTPAQTVAVLRRLDALRSFGRPLLLAVSRKDFVGAITGRPPSDRDAGTLAALAAGVDAGASIVRVHDVAAAADYLAVRAVLRGERVLAPLDGLTPDRYPDGPPPHLSLGLTPKSPAAEPNAAGRPPIGDRMPTVLDRSALEQSPLADLHLLANELGVDGFRRLRKPDLVDAILVRQGGEAAEPEPEPDAEAASEPVVAAVAEAAEAADADDDSPKRSRRGRRGGRGRRRDEDGDGGGGGAERDEPVAEGDERVVEGAVELLSNGSGFLRLSPPDATDDDVYISAAQVKRCELVSGDRIAGPMRAARRSERFPSLIRVDTINGRPADEVAEGTRFEDLPVAWPSERIALGSGDETVRAIEWLTPFGKGSRVVIAGAARSGKSEALRRLAAALAAVKGLEVSAVLTGVRPEEIADYPVAPSAALTFAASSETQGQAVEQAVETGRRVAARGGDAVVLIDSFEYLSGGAARRALAAGRNLAGGGSLTVIATAPAPVGGETTVVALDRATAAAGTFPALDLVASGTLKPELLVGAAGAAAIRAAVTGGPVEAVPAAAEAIGELVAAPEPLAEPSVEEPVATKPTPVVDPATKPKPKRSKPAAKKKPAAAKAKPAAAAKPKPAAAAKPKPAAAAKAKPAAAAKPKPAAAAKAKPAAAAKKKPAAPAKRKPAAKKKPAAS